ncbi:MAG: ATP synthase subunit C [Treponema sp.]|nr:ATP synthase subunit C [Treponema sp.]
MNKKFFALLALIFCTSLFAISAQSAETSELAETVVEQAEPASNAAMWKYISAALAVGFSCIAGGMAVGKIGAAAMGAMSENAELSGKALPFVGLAEGICLWGFLVGLLIIVL